MNTILKWGVILGILVEVWTYIMGFAGWHTDPTLQNLWLLVILIEIGVLVIALRKTAAEGRAYGAQVGAGTLIALVAAVIIFVGSYLATTVVFPDYFAEIRAAGAEAFRAQGMSEAEINATLDQYAPMQTPFLNALTGVIGTIVTGALASLVIAIFIRKKP